MLLFKNSGANRLVESNERQLQLILPGTLWCGDGNVAKSDKDLGLFYKTDRCCKHHDLCPKYIESGQRFMNLENIGVFTRYLQHIRPWVEQIFFTIFVTGLIVLVTEHFTSA